MANYKEWLQNHMSNGDHEKECRKTVSKRGGVVQAYCTLPKGHKGNHQAHHPAR